MEKKHADLNTCHVSAVGGFSWYSLPKISRCKYQQKMRRLHVFDEKSYSLLSSRTDETRPPSETVY